MFKKTLMLSAVLLGSAGYANAGTTINVFDSIMSGIQHRVSVIPGSLNCHEQTGGGMIEKPIEEMVQIQYDASVKLVNYFIVERVMHVSDPSNISEIDKLAMSEATQLKFDCVEDPIIDESNQRNIKESYLLATKIIENRQ